MLTISPDVLQNLSPGVRSTPGPGSIDAVCSSLEVERPAENHRASSAGGCNRAEAAAGQAHTSLREERMVEPVAGLRIQAHVHALREANVLRRGKVEREPGLTVIPNRRTDH